MKEIKSKILITTSGLGSRMGNITKFTNKSLIKLGDKAIISHIIDSYPYGDFVITLGHFGNLVKQYIEIAHPDRNFEFVWVDPYEGEGSGLLTSMSFAKDKLQCPFIFHACDTILSEKWRPPLLNNYMGCVESSSPDLFRTVCTNDGLITKINDKGEINYDFAYVGVAGIYDYDLFWNTLEKTQKNNIKDSSDCHVLSEMMKQVNINVWPVHDWFDTGSVQNLTKAREAYPQHFNVLDKSEESIFFIDNSVIKFFADSEICQHRVERIKILKGLVPKLISQSENFYKYEMDDGELLSNVITEDKIIDLFEFAKKELWVPMNIDQDKFTEKTYEFYHDKTIKRINQFHSINNIKDKSDVINNTIVPDIGFMIKNIDWEWLSSSRPTGFHGDFILDNILYHNRGSQNFILLDWRQDFGGLIDAGDMYYDLAKLNHNLILNHNLLLNKHFTILTDRDNIRCDVLRYHNMVKCQERYINHLNDNNIDILKIKMLTAIIWLNMAPLHTYPLNNFLYYFGKYNLWKELRKKIYQK